MELLFAYLAGLLTLINPCVLPVLPIVLAASVAGNRHGPVFLAAGLVSSFTIVGLFVASVGPAIGLTEDVISRAGALIMIGFGAVLLLPRVGERFSTATAGFAGKADMAINGLDQSRPTGLFLGGMLLAVVWSPCIGPTLGGAISLAAQGQGLVWPGVIMFAFSLGVASIILALGYGAREAIAKRQQRFAAIADKSKPILGVVFVCVGLFIFFQMHHVLETVLLDIMPFWLQDLSVRF
ncbi:MAG: cytochrome c biogenesis CcdA family protein [Pseudomonadota bacterium]